MDSSIENRIQALEKWKEERISQQITYPLDVNSLTILRKYFLYLVGVLTNTGVSGQEFASILIQQENAIAAISVYSALMTYTVNITTDIITLGANILTGQQGTLQNNVLVTVYAPGIQPLGVPPKTSIGPIDPNDPLTNGGGYFVVNSTGTTIQLSATKGGAPFDFTSAGTGIQYISIQ